MDRLENDEYTPTDNDEDVFDEGYELFAISLDGNEISNEDWPENDDILPAVC